MKRLFLIIFFFIFFLFSLRIAFAQEAMSSVLPKEVMEYQLPYPGLLPDNPFYSVKVFRDKIISFLISDPLKKAEFDLLQSEKRFSAGINLLNKGKKDLGQATISKSINYFEESINKAQEAKKQGQDAHVIIDKLAVSIDRQEYEIVTLSIRQSAKVKEQLMALEKRMDDLEKKVKVLKS